MTNDMIYLARLTVEAASPLGIGSGRRGVMTDRLVVRDAYGLPYLPGTSLAGCLRSALVDTVEDSRIIDDLFGTQNNDGGWGSRVMLSSGHLVGSNGKVVGESAGVPDYNDPYLKALTEGSLPERDHVRINSRGVADAKGRGKFDEQLVPKGVCFVFDLLLTGSADDADDWETLVRQFSQPFFRIGGGTRKGFGKLSVRRIDQVKFDLRQTDQLDAYLDWSGALDQPLPAALVAVTAPAAAPVNDSWETYTLCLKARDYFQFGKGVGGTAKDRKIKDGWVNKKVKRETTVTWDGDKPTVINDDKAYYLIPATSIKGALSHRTAFHYNRLEGVYVEHQQTTVEAPDYDAIVAEIIGSAASDLNTAASIEAEIERLNGIQKAVDTIDLNDKSPSFKAYTEHLKVVQTDEGRPNVGEDNGAVRALFGFAVERRENAQEKESAQRGKLLIDDVFLPAKDVTTKTFSHVMIDRFTGGAKAGALFNEEVASTAKEIEVKIHVHNSAFDGDEVIRQAFEAALEDLRTGQLPLGGGVAKGHGIFTGELVKS